MLHILVLLHILPCGSAVLANTMTKLDSTQSLISKLGQFAKVNVTATMQVVSSFECSTRCMLTPSCSILFYGGINKQCKLGELTTHCDQAVNLSAPGMQSFGIWTENKKFGIQKSLIAAGINRTFTNSSMGPFGQVQTMLISKTGYYNVSAKGAKSGRQSNYSKDGCLGAVKGGSFMFNSGDELRVVVGQEGGPTRPGAWNDGSGAGGASFVYTKSGDLLLAAGGAGGVKYHKNSYCSGQVGVNAGQSWDGGSNNPSTGNGGENGTTGSIGPDQSDANDGGVGASWFSSGPPVRAGETWGGRPGHNLSGNFSGGLAPAYYHSIEGLFEAHGGFGGGGSGSPESRDPNRYGNGGSGGGYSSGGAGSKLHTGGGGSSFASPMATNVWGITGGNTEAHGSVTFTYAGPTCG